MDKICKTIIANCNDRNNIQYKTSALETLVNYYGYEAMPYLLEAARHPDKTTEMLHTGFLCQLQVHLLQENGLHIIPKPCRLPDLKYKYAWAKKR